MPGSTAAPRSQPRADGCRAPNYGSAKSFAARRKISVGLARCNLLLNKSPRRNMLGLTRVDVRSRNGLCLSRSLFPGNVISRPEKKTPKHPSRSNSSLAETEFTRRTRPSRCRPANCPRHSSWRRGEPASGTAANAGFQRRCNFRWELASIPRIQSHMRDGPVSPGFKPRHAN
jgi:hypothetical protein